MFNLFIKVKLDFLNIKTIVETVKDKIDRYNYINSKFWESKNTPEKKGKYQSGKNGQYKCLLNIKDT